MSAIPKPSKERSVASALPYSQHIDDYTVITHEGDLTGTIRVHGLSFETIGHKDLDNFTQQWFSAMSNIARKPISAACTSPKPPPAWPEGTARPINATIPGKAQR